MLFLRTFIQIVSVFGILTCRLEIERLERLYPRVEVKLLQLSKEDDVQISKRLKIRIENGRRILYERKKEQLG